MDESKLVWRVRLGLQMAMLYKVQAHLDPIYTKDNAKLNLYPVAGSYHNYSALPRLFETKWNIH